MFKLQIPGFGQVSLRHLVTDFTGTLSCDGKLLPGVRERLLKISDFLAIHVLTADTFGAVRNEVKGISCTLRVLEGTDHDFQKEDYVNDLGADSVVAFGNGSNDRRMLSTARLGIAVTGDEGCAVDAIRAADIHVNSAAAGLDLILNPIRCKATLRF